MWVRYAIAGLCAFVGVLFLIINSVLLARGAARWGLEVWEQLSYGAVAASVPWIIAVMPFLVKASMGKERRHLGRLPTLWTAVGCFMWLLFAAYNLIGASGALSFVRNDVIAGRKHEVNVETGQRDRRASLVERRNTIGRVRPAAALAPLIEAEKTKPQWQWSGGCRSINASTAKYCAGIEKLKAEAAEARGLELIVAEITAIDQRLESQAPVSDAADPQARFLSGLTGLDERMVSERLPVFTPIVLELGSMFLLGFAIVLVGFDHGRVLERLPPPVPAMVPTPIGVPLETRQRQLAQWFFSQCVRRIAGGALPEEDWYAHYSSICRRSNDLPLPVEKFRQIARAYVPDITEVDGKHYYKQCLPLIPKSA